MTVLALADTLVRDAAGQIPSALLAALRQDDVAAARAMLPTLTVKALGTACIWLAGVPKQGKRKPDLIALVSDALPQFTAAAMHAEERRQHTIRLRASVARNRQRLAQHKANGGLAGLCPCGFEQGRDVAAQVRLEETILQGKLA